MKKLFILLLLFSVFNLAFSQNDQIRANQVPKITNTYDLGANDYNFDSLFIQHILLDGHIIRSMALSDSLWYLHLSDSNSVWLPYWWYFKLTDSLGIHRDSIGVHRTVLNAHTDTNIIFRESLNAHSDSIDALRDDIENDSDDCTDSIAIHRAELNLHQDTLTSHNTRINNAIQRSLDSIATHRILLNAHADSIAAHLLRLNANIDSITNHRTELNAHLDSIVIHRTAINAHTDSIANRYTKVETRTLIGDSLAEVWDSLGVRYTKIETQNLVGDSLAEIRDSLDVRYTKIEMGIIIQDSLGRFFDSTQVRSEINDSLSWVRDSIDALRDDIGTGGATDTTSLSNRIDAHTDSIAQHRTELNLHSDTLISHDSRINAAIQRAQDTCDTKKRKDDTTNTASGYTTLYQNSLKQNIIQNLADTSLYAKYLFGANNFFGTGTIGCGPITITGLLGVTVASGYAATFMGGNVGIGTTSPTQKFEVQGGNIWVSGSITGNGGNSYFTGLRLNGDDNANTIYNANRDIAITTDITGGQGGIVIKTNTGNVGIGLTTNIDSLLTINLGAHIKRGLLVDGATSLSSLTLGTDLPISEGGTGAGTFTANALLKGNTTSALSSSAIYDSATVNKIGAVDRALLLSGTTGATPTSGAGTRLMWIPVKGAFRAGTVDDISWNDENIGTNSSAFGYDCIASGVYSSAFGFTTQAIANNAFSIGYGTIASGSNSFACGFNTTANSDVCIAGGYASIASGNTSIALQEATIASGNFSTSLGFFTKSESQCSFSIGRYNVGGGTAASWVATDPLFEIGNGTGTGALANAFTVYKNGNTTVSGTLTIGSSLVKQGVFWSDTIKATQWDGGTTNLVVATGRTSLGIRDIASVDFADAATTAGSTPAAPREWTEKSSTFVNKFYRVYTHATNNKYLKFRCQIKTNGGAEAEEIRLTVEELTATTVGDNPTNYGNDEANGAILCTVDVSSLTNGYEYTVYVAMRSVSGYTNVYMRYPIFWVE